MIVHHDLRRAPCVRPVIVLAEALFAEQRDIIAGVLLGPQRGQLGPLPSLAPDVAFAPITDLHALTSYRLSSDPKPTRPASDSVQRSVWQSIRRATRRVDGVMISQAANSTWAAAGTCWRV